MKRIIFCALLLALFPYPAMAESLNAETAATAIVGKWKLLSFEGQGYPDKDYQQEEVIWEFDGKRLSVKSDDLGGHYEDSYRIERSIFRIKTTIILLSKELKRTHLAYGKFVIKSIDGDIMTLIDWDKKVKYILQRLPTQ